MKKSIITSTTISNPYGLYPLGTRAGDLAFLSLQVPTNTETKRLVQGYNDLRVADIKRAKALATGLATSDSREGPAIAQVWQLLFADGRPSRRDRFINQQYSFYDVISDGYEGLSGIH